MSSAAAAATTTTAALNGSQIFQQTLKILNTNSVHFLTISLLFLPLIFFISVTVISSGSVSLISLLNFKTLTTLLAVAVTVTAVAGIALITYSTHQSIIKKQPLTFISTFKSLSHSFIPLLSTIIAGSIKSFIIITAVTVVIESLGLGFQFDVSVITNKITVTIILFCIAIWGSAVPVSVLESKSGFHSLTKSENQSFKFQFVSFIFMIIAVFMSATFFGYYSVIHKQSEVKWSQIMQIGVTYLQFSLYVLAYVVANTVSYVNCTMARGTEEEKKSFIRVTFGGFTFMMYLCNIFSTCSLLIG